MKNENEKIMCVCQKSWIAKMWSHRIMRITAYMLVCVFVIICASYVSECYLPLGFHMRSPFVGERYHVYENAKNGIRFRYTDRYVIDVDAQHKYGDDYVIGIHTEHDARTGCDVRYSDVGINFTKDDAQINEAIYNDLAKNVIGLAAYQGERIAIDGEDAMRVEFLLTDPLGSTLHITQTIVTHDGHHYLIACGAGRGQYDYYSDDFRLLTDSMAWLK